MFRLLPHGPHPPFLLRLRLRLRLFFPAQDFFFLSTRLFPHPLLDLPLSPSSLSSFSCCCCWVSVGSRFWRRPRGFLSRFSRSVETWSSLPLLSFGVRKPACTPKSRASQINRFAFCMPTKTKSSLLILGKLEEVIFVTENSQLTKFYASENQRVILNENLQIWKIICLISSLRLVIRN